MEVLVERPWVDDADAPEGLESEEMSVTGNDVVDAARIEHLRELDDGLVEVREFAGYCQRVVVELRAFRPLERR